MSDWIYFLTSGTVFGISAGLSPGPLQMLVISETLKHGTKEGMKVAIAPLLTDLPIVLATLYLVSRLSDISQALGVVSILGGGYLAFLAVESLRFKGDENPAKAAEPKSIRKGMTANFLNPSPYLFWFSVGAPTVLKASEVHFGAVILFLLPLYFFLVGLKITIAVIAGQSGKFLKSRVYVWTVRLLGAVLLCFAAHFVIRGLGHLGIL